MNESKLLKILPEYICTPDGMEIDAQGNLVLSCPNFAEDDNSGIVVRIDKDLNVKKWFDVPVHPETGVARNMGIALGPDGYVYLCDNQGWSERPDLLFKGRVIKVKADDEGNILNWKVVAYNMEHPNGVRIKGDYLYVTQSYMHPEKDPSGKLVSGVYRFSLTDENIEITNTKADPNCFVTFLTQNPNCQYGMDGIAFDKKGDMYVGNFGDGAVHKVTFNEDGSVRDSFIWAKDPEQLVSTDGMCFDEDGNLYIADFSFNSIVKVTPDAKVTRIAQSPDNDGLDGGLDQPGEPIIWNGKIVASCFDLVTDPGKVNNEHTMPATLAYLEM